MDVPTNVPLMIDGDIFLYRCGFAVEKTKYLVEQQNPEGYIEKKDYAHFNSSKEAKNWCKGHEDQSIIWSRREVEPVENALTAIKNSIFSVTDKFWPKGEKWEGRIFLTGKGNFRELLGTHRTYKDNRDPAHRPTHYKAIRDYLITKHEAYVVNGEEADDAIGREAYTRAIDKYVIVSNDKDLDQLSGWHYDWTKENLYFVDDETAIKMFYKQMLAGDATDNVKGPVSWAKAVEAIDKLGSPAECALETREIYKKKYGDSWGEMADEIGELVWIRRGAKPADAKLHNPFWNHIHSASA